MRQGRQGYGIPLSNILTISIFLLFISVYCIIFIGDCKELLGNISVDIGPLADFANA